MTVLPFQGEVKTVRTELPGSPRSVESLTLRAKGLPSVIRPVVELHLSMLQWKAAPVLGYWSHPLSSTVTCLIITPLPWIISSSTQECYFSPILKEQWKPLSWAHPHSCPLCFSTLSCSNTPRKSCP
jgi:hypothetical protein